MNGGADMTCVAAVLVTIVILYTLSNRKNWSPALSGGMCASARKTETTGDVSVKGPGSTRDCYTGARVGSIEAVSDDDIYPKTQVDKAKKPWDCDADIVKQDVTKIEKKKSELREFMNTTQNAFRGFPNPEFARQKLLSALD